MSPDTLQRSLGELIRTSRVAAGLTQEELGARAGIVGKYVSEIERGTRDVPLSTLLSIVEGLGLSLDIRFQQRTGAPQPQRPPLPRPVDEVARLIAEVAPEQRGKVLAIVRSVISLARRK